MRRTLASFWMPNAIAPDEFLTTQRGCDAQWTKNMHAFDLTSSPGSYSRTQASRATLKVAGMRAATERRLQQLTPRSLTLGMRTAPPQQLQRRHPRPAHHLQEQSADTAVCGCEPARVSRRHPAASTPSRPRPRHAPAGHPARAGRRRTRCSATRSAPPGTGRTPGNAARRGRQRQFAPPPGWRASHPWPDPSVCCRRPPPSNGPLI